MNKRLWTEKEISILKSVYESCDDKELMKLIPNKTRCAIYHKASRLKLSKSAEATGKNRSKELCGSKNPMWKGGTYLHEGYRNVWVNGKYRKEHDLVMEKKIGRKLTKDEVVHHINGNKLDNRIENLELMTKSTHISYHDSLRKGRKYIRRSGKCA